MAYILFATILYAIGILLSAAASRSGNTNLVAAVTNTVSAVVPILVIIPILTRSIIVDQKYSILLAALAGLSIALFVITINKAYAVNDVAIVAPIVFGGAIFLSTVLSFVIFKEKASVLQIIGLTVLAAGFIIVTIARMTGK